MNLTAVTDLHIIEVMTWFDSEEKLRSWAGPNFTYPYSQASFKEDLILNSLKSFSLISSSHFSNDEKFLAFGQCYRRVGRCHLGRLVVSPQHRGEGIIANLIKLLIEYGLQSLAVDEASLFVLKDNKSAINAYLKYGFAFAEYPETMPLQGCHYMTLGAS